MIKWSVFLTTKKVKQLEQMLGHKTVEADILKDALEIAQTKKYISHMPLLLTRRYSTQQIALTLGVRRLKQPDATKNISKMSSIKGTKSVQFVFACNAS